MWARTLCDELEELGFTLSYPTLTRNIRARGLRPVCAECRSATDRPNAIIEHEPGDETQWDWLDLPDPPESWGWGRTAHLLVGSLAYSGKWRGWLAPSTDSRTGAGLGPGGARPGRGDAVVAVRRMATVCDPARDGSPPLRRGGQILLGFGGMCPARRGNRKGVVEKTNHTAAQRWWRTLPDDVTAEQAQGSLDRFASVRGDTRMRATPDGRPSVAAVSEHEPRAPVPASPPSAQTSAIDGIAHPRAVEDAAPAVAVLQAGRGHQHDDEQAQRVDDDVSLAPVDLLARVVTATVGTDGVGALDRLGVHDPGAGHRVTPGGIAHRRPQRVVDAVGETVVGPGLEVPVTVSHGGKSCGSWRHEQPIRLRFKIASTIRRRGWVAGRPPGRGSTIGAISSHCASVRSDGSDSGSHAHIVDHIDHMSHISHAGAPPLSKHVLRAAAPSPPWPTPNRCTPFPQHRTR